jgi:hypothetical protein
MQVGDCRYGAGGHGNYATISGDDATSPEQCVSACAADAQCHAVDMHGATAR